MPYLTLRQGTAVDYNSIFWGVRMKRYFTVTSAIAVGLMMASASIADITDNSGAGFSIPDNDPAGITSAIVISADETINDVSVTLFGATHSWVGDVTATVSNGTTTADLMVRVGDPGGTSGDSSTLDGNYTFADGGDDFWTAADNAGFGSPIPVGTYAPSGVADAPVSLAGSFGGASTQGTWTLFMSDAAQGDIGSITGWGISCSSGAAIPEPGSLALLGAMGLACIVRRRR